MQFIMIVLVIVFIWGLVEFGHHFASLEQTYKESVEILENHRYASDDRLFHATDVKKITGVTGVGVGNPPRMQEGPPKN